MFERFTEKAIKVIMLAQEEARRLGHNFVGTEQILLGLIGEGTGIAAKTLKSMGVNLKDARVEVEKIIGRGSGFVAVEIPFTPRAKRVLELSWDEARQLGHNYIGTEHLLLGLIREGEGVATRILENLGVDLSKVRSNVIRMLGETRTGAAPAGTATGGRSKTPTVDEFGTLRNSVLIRWSAGKKKLKDSCRYLAEEQKTTLFLSVSRVLVKQQLQKGLLQEL
jgi:ATP-dependent Clp protease ATP-binding subunit ClpC